MLRLASAPLKPLRVAEEPLQRRRTLCQQSVMAWWANCWPNRIRPYEHTRLIDHRLRRCLKDQSQHPYLQISQPPRTGKPIAVDELVLVQGGRRRRLGELVVGDKVCTHLGRYRPILQIHEQPNYPCLKIVTRGGREIISGYDHPFLTPRGWIEAQDLVRRDRLLVMTSDETDVRLSDEAFILAGFMVGDGNTTGNHNGSFAARFTTADPDLQQEFQRCCDAMGFTCKPAGTRGMDWQLSGGVRDWLRLIGLAEKSSHEKRVPEFVFTGSKRQIQLFVDAYFSCDGHISRRGIGSQKWGQPRDDVRFEFYSVSKELLEDVRHLLARFGVAANLRLKNGMYAGQVHQSWRLSFGSTDDVFRYKRAAKIPGKKQRVLDEHEPIATEFDERVKDEVVSVESWKNTDCRCLTVEEDATFTVNDIVVHNSMMALVFAGTQYIANHPDHNVFVVTHNQTSANRWGRACRNIFAAHAGPIWGLQVDPKVKGNALWGIAGHEGTFNSIGWGGPLTGNKVHLLIIDDLIKDSKEALSPITRQDIWNWWEGTATQRIQDNPEIQTRCVSIQTRWHVDDLNGKLIQAERAGGMVWDKVILPALADRGDVFDRETGKLLIPAGGSLCEDILPLEYLEQVRRTKSSYWWECNYQQRPITQDGILWEADCFSDDKFLDHWPDRVKYLVVGVDPATGMALRDGDYSAIVALALGYDGKLYVDADLEKSGPQQTIQRLARFCERLPMAPDLIAMEANGFQFLMTAMGEEYFTAHDIAGRFMPYKTTDRGVPEKKPDRIAELDPLIRSDLLRYVKGEGTQLLISQLQNFPSKDHDDGPDALELASWVLSNF